jgi:hypothetical protein
VGSLYTRKINKMTRKLYVIHAIRVFYLENISCKQSFRIIRAAQTQAFSVNATRAPWRRGSRVPSTGRSIRWTRAPELQVGNNLQVFFLAAVRSLLLHACARWLTKWRAESEWHQGKNTMVLLSLADVTCSFFTSSEFMHFIVIITGIL